MLDNNQQPGLIINEVHETGIIGLQTANEHTAGKRSDEYINHASRSLYRQNLSDKFI